MLVLTRKIQESLIVGEVQAGHRMLTVKVLAIHGDRVKLGFEMDDTVDVRRIEVRNRAPLGAVLPETLVPTGGVASLKIVNTGDES